MNVVSFYACVFFIVKDFHFYLIWPVAHLFLLGQVAPEYKDSSFFFFEAKWPLSEFFLYIE